MAPSKKMVLKSIPHFSFEGYNLEIKSGFFTFALTQLLSYLFTMSTKTIKIIYWISTGLLTLLMLFSAGNYFFNHEAIVNAFEALGYPTYLIYPLGIAKLLGLIAILTRKYSTLKEWAYAGFFFDFILAFFAHIMVGDGEFAGALVAMILLFASYFSEKKAFQDKES